MADIWALTLVLRIENRSDLDLDLCSRKISFFFDGITYDSIPTIQMSRNLLPKWNEKELFATVHTFVYIVYYLSH